MTTFRRTFRKALRGSLPAVFIVAAACARDRQRLREAACLGPSNAKHFAVYLHGVDDPSISPQELGNRENLARIADALSIRIALPRASAPCKGGPSSSICWSWDYSDADIDAAAVAIERAARGCFGDRPFGVIGFSNGGYLLSKLYRTCKLHERVPHSTWLVTVGSSAFKGPLETEPQRLIDCGSMTMITGTSDTYNIDADDHYLHVLQDKGAAVTSVHFDGAHLVPEEPTKTAISVLLGR